MFVYEPIRFLGWLLDGDAGKPSCSRAVPNDKGQETCPERQRAGRAVENDKRAHRLAHPLVIGILTVVGWQWLLGKVGNALPAAFRPCEGCGVVSTPRRTSSPKGQCAGRAV